jgi:hypothetical protein
MNPAWVFHHATAAKESRIIRKVDFEDTDLGHLNRLAL